MEQVGNSKFKCLYCSCELSTAQHQCLSCKPKKDTRGFCCNKAVLGGSCVLVLVSVFFWAYVFVFYKQYPTFHDMAYVIAAWSFFVGCYCLIITYAHLYKLKQEN